MDYSYCSQNHLSLPARIAVSRVSGARGSQLW